MHHRAKQKNSKTRSQMIRVAFIRTLRSEKLTRQLHVTSEARDRRRDRRSTFRGTMFGRSFTVGRSAFFRRSTWCLPGLEFPTRTIFQSHAAPEHDEHGCSRSICIMLSEHGTAFLLGWPAPFVNPHGR